MRKLSFQEALEQILQEDSRYDEQAYHFLREALDFTVTLLSKPVEGPGKHVAGAELLDGIRQFALKEYGPLAKTVLNSWGVKESAHWGDIVFNLVDKGVLGKTEDDRREDFEGAYDFDDAFVKPFLPSEEPKTGRVKSKE